MVTRYQAGDEAIEINYQGRVRIVEPITGHPDMYWAEGIGWELPPWDSPTPCHADDLIPLVVHAHGSTLEAWEIEEQMAWERAEGQRVRARAQAGPQRP